MGFKITIQTLKKYNSRMSGTLEIAFFKRRFYIFICRQRERVGEREEEKRQCVVVSCVPPTGDLACNPGMRPDWELNQQPFGSQAGAQFTEPRQPGWNCGDSFIHSLIFLRF